MIFRGHQKSSFIDYPDKISTVLFTGGCNFRCPYCHNAELISDKGIGFTEDYVFDYLKKKSKFLDAVCISGGEPTLHTDLFDFIRRLKEIGLLIKLDTNGTRPLVLKQLIQNNLLDFVAMDIKAPFHKYESVVNTKVDIQDIKISIDIIRESDIEYEFRTTVCKELLTKNGILEIADYIKKSKRYSVQNFHDGETVLAGYNKLKPFDIEVLNEIEEEIKSFFEVLTIRK